MTTQDDSELDKTIDEFFWNTAKHVNHDVTDKGGSASIVWMNTRRKEFRQAILTLMAERERDLLTYVIGIDNMPPHDELWRYNGVLRGVLAEKFDVIKRAEERGISLTPQSPTNR